MVISRVDDHLIVTGIGHLQHEYVNLMPGTGHNGVPPEYESLFVNLTDRKDSPIDAWVDQTDQRLVHDVLRRSKSNHRVLWSCVITELATAHHTPPQREVLPRLVRIMPFP